MKHRISVLALALVLMMGCAGTTPKNITALTSKWEMSHEDSVNVAIIDVFKHQSAVGLGKAKSQNEFDSLLVKIQSAEKPNWKELVARKDSIKARKLCGASILGANGKLNPCAASFMRRGLPTSSWNLPGFNLRTKENLNFFLFSWGEEMVMMSGEEFPQKVYAEPSLKLGIGTGFREGFSKLDHRVKVPNFLVDSVGQYEILIVSEVGLDGINLETFKQGTIRFKTEITEILDDTEKLVMEIDHRIKIEPYTWIASKASNREDHFIQDHAKVSLKPGTYRFEVKSIGDGNCQGEQSFTMTVPHRTSIQADVSDLLFVDPNPPTGDLNNLISHWGRSNLWPTSNFFQGTTATAFAEAKVDSAEEHLITVVLVPYTKGHGEKSSDTLEGVKIFSQTCFIGEEATLLEMQLDFANISHGSYWMIASVTKPGTRVKGESVCLVRVKEAKVPTQAKQSEIVAAEGETPQTTPDLIEMSDSELKALFKLVNEDFYDQIRDTTNSKILRAMIEKYRAQKDFETRSDTPYRNEWWENILSRYVWGVSHLKTPIDAILQDVRWRFILTLGIDFAVDPSLASSVGDGSEFGTSTYVFEWTNGTKLAFDTQTGGAVPTKVRVLVGGDDIVLTDPFDQKRVEDQRNRVDPSAAIEGTRRLNEIFGEEPRFEPFLGVEEVLESNLSTSCLFSKAQEGEENPIFELWVSAWTPAVAFSDSDLVYDSLVSRLVVYDSEKNLVGDIEETQWGLRALLPQTKDQRKAHPFPSYQGGRLEPGTYSVRFSLSAGKGRNFGMYKISFQVPPRSASWVETSTGIWGTSDILFPTQTVAPGNPGIIVDGELYNNTPIPVFSEKDSLPVLMQIQTPAVSDYLVVVTLIQIDKDEEIFRRIAEKTDVGKEHVVYSGIFRADENGRGLFEAKLDLSVLEPGSAAVIIQAMDPYLSPDSEKQPRVISYRKFHVVK